LIAARIDALRRGQLVANDRAAPPPAMERDAYPDRLDDPERPRALQEPYADPSAQASAKPSTHHGERASNA
jgi:hypothetical protein